MLVFTYSILLTIINEKKKKKKRTLILLLLFPSTNNVPFLSKFLHPRVHTTYITKREISLKPA